MRWALIFGLELHDALVVCVLVRGWFAGGGPVPGEVRIACPQSMRPELDFACELATPELPALLTSPDLIAALKQLDGVVTLSVIDLSTERAGVMRRLNESRIRVTAWLALPKQQGYSSPTDGH